jgi:hypothetical protein
MSFIKNLKEYWPQACLIIGSIGLTEFGSASDIKKENIKWFRSPIGITFTTSAILNIVGTIASLERTKRIDTLEQEVADLEDLLGTQLNYPLVFEARLQKIANDLGLKDTERISIYRHNQQDKFILIGRYSESPSYIKRGRSAYPDDEGCIGTAWNNGEAFDDNLPDPDNDISSYVNELKKRWNINKQTSRGFIMKSRNYAAYAIKESSSPGKRIAVIVFESTQINKLDKDI